MRCRLDKCEVTSTSPFVETEKGTGSSRKKKSSYQEAVRGRTNQEKEAEPSGDERQCFLIHFM